MRKFEKISFKEFKEIISDDKEFYDNFKLPERKTKYSAGYDFSSPIDKKLKKRECALIPTGVKCKFPGDEVLMIFIRSSLGVKHKIKLSNGTGIIDADYYGNTDNEGHIFIAIENTGKDDFIINKGDRIAQGIFIKYYTVTDEEEIIDERKSGFGSTDGN